MVCVNSAWNKNKLRFLSVQKIDGGVKFLKKQNTGKLRIIPLGGLEQI